ncbi:MAG TPA: hypothetical protein VIJ18_11550 [Microbacteriaceae bacterium]
MIAVTEPQVWTVIGVLAATLVSFVAAALTMITRTVNVQFERVSEKIDLKFDGLHGELGARLDSLDRDVQALANRVWDEKRP